MKQSIVLRGSLHNDINNIILLIRNWFDGEIVICTWKTEQNKIKNFYELVDKIHFIDDPGAGPIQNIKRQMKSFQEGLDVSTGDEILISRADMLFHKNIFSFLYKNKQQNEKFCFVDDKIIIGNIMTINPLSNEIPNTYRISDWFHCSTKKSLEKMVCGIDLVFNANENLINEYKLCTEKLWIHSILSKLFDVDLYDSSQYDKHFWDLLYNNFILLNSISTLNTENLKYKNQPENLSCYITEYNYNCKL